MRYKSLKGDNLVLYKNNGKIAYKFKNGVLTVGLNNCRTGTGNYIVSAPQTESDNNLQRFFATDLAGATTQCLEMCGCGTLNCVDLGGSAVTTFNIGKRGSFAEAPVISTGATTTSAYGNIWYEVLSGTVTYNGVAYTKGQKFKTVAGTTTTSGTNATFALTTPPDMNNFEKEAYAITQLALGDESTNYWLPADGGYTARQADSSTGRGYVNS
jgi:hypothetical protein